jgi:hypothetical protein
MSREVWMSVVGRRKSRSRVAVVVDAKDGVAEVRL